MPTISATAERISSAGDRPAHRSSFLKTSCSATISAMPCSYTARNSASLLVVRA